jgi:hypothetical protein
MGINERQKKMLLKYKTDADGILKQMSEVTVRARKKIDEAKYNRLLEESIKRMGSKNDI